MTFKDLGIIEPILKALQCQGYTTPTPIQEQSIPILLQGKDLLGAAQTGTGKTAAFAIPILQHLYLKSSDKKINHRGIKALVVTPTRELALQIAESFSEYGQFTGIRNTVIFGGVKQGPQVTNLKKGAEVLIATPGRLLDLMGQGLISLKDVEYFVLDEADRMLDMGFINDIKRLLVKLPVKRQSLFFSATMLPNIVALSQKILGNPEKVAVKPEQTTAEKVEQSIYFVNKNSKTNLLVHLLVTNPVDSALIFSRTKHGANKIVKMLDKAGFAAEAIHSNKSQGARQRALGDFKSGRTSILVATDIAARGIDIDELSLVVNYDLPNIPETYVHRIGRTGRANLGGMALSFCDMEEREYLRDIQKLISQKIPVITDHPFIADSMEITAAGAWTNPRESSSRGRTPQQSPKPSRHRPERSRSDASQSNRGERSQPSRSERPQSNRGERSQQPRSERPQSNRGERSQQPRSERPQSNRGERSQQPRSERPQSNRGERSRPQHSERPQTRGVEKSQQHRTEKPGRHEQEHTAKAPVKFGRKFTTRPGVRKQPAR